ncbi:MAG: RNA-protein complex protein Nop10 [Nanoarchaeota archaeon]|nr:RNA-protein complex protein Nop10 [Nanoarchaeota archaeon]
MTEILKCPKCNNYTLKNNCDKCNLKTLSPKPAKFSIDDKYGKYRRLAKKND